jgi:dynein heavy chain
LSRIYQGLTRSTLDKFKSINEFVKLWRNEVTRTFIDKLCDPDDVKRVKDQIPDLIKEFFPNCAGDDLEGPLIFGDFMQANPDDMDSNAP